MYLLTQAAIEPPAQKPDLACQAPPLPQKLTCDGQWLLVTIYLVSSPQSESNYFPDHPGLEQPKQDIERKLAAMFTIG